jgi:hypothetical protein
MRTVLDRRERMIAETSAFLTWALSSGVDVPRIPRRRVEEGGFARLLHLPGARTAMNYWWWRTLQAVDRLYV